MGVCFSCRSSSSSSSSAAESTSTVRVVHLNGYVEDFEQPVSVSQITGKPSKHFVCTPAQLLSSGSKPLKQDALLQPGQIYLLLPYSALQADVSPLDLASIVRKLTSAAKSSRNSGSDSRKSPGSSPLRSPHGSRPAWNSSLSPSRSSPNRFAEPEFGLMGNGGQRSCRARSWKPILDTIRERSFTRRSESDIQERVFGAIEKGSLAS
ncbi:hypothetical protein FEM48_Zijuj01G0016500 [Ziziphus jujuba var. spinosa]|uniref:Uncharacterized protein n=1 Tax=Ziziphus jujuba var. spinosa TaxID=714518 RepID=A0A978VYD8_ZIZJJ|nr:hypothetical protein FEM48_Zijuj01G0016500 [Ziziphus jujuba var. spinosa]